MLSDCQMFKVAMLQECAEAGLTAEETHEAVKYALAELEMTKSANIPGLGALEDIAKQIPGFATAAYIGVPLALGAGGGVAAAKLQGLNDIDPEEVKQQEKIDAYRRAAQRARLQRRLRSSREDRRPSRPLL